MPSSDEEDEVNPSSPTTLLRHEDVPLPEEDPDPPPGIVNILSNAASNGEFFLATTIDSFTVLWPRQSRWIKLAGSISDEEISSMNPLDSFSYQEEISYITSLKRKDQMLSKATALLEQLLFCQVRPATILGLNPTSPKYERAKAKFTTNHSDLNLCNPEISGLQESYSTWEDVEDKEAESFHRTRRTTWNQDRWNAWRYRIPAGKVLESLKEKKAGFPILTLEADQLEDKIGIKLAELMSELFREHKLISLNHEQLLQRINQHLSLPPPITSTPSLDQHTSPPTSAASEHLSEGKTNLSAATITNLEAYIRTVEPFLARAEAIPDKQMTSGQRLACVKYADKG